MPDPFTIIDRLQREWPVITGAPLSFVIAVLIVSTIFGLFLRWHYKALLTQKDEQLKTKDEQLTARGQVISEYRERQKADLESKAKDLGERALPTERKWLSDVAEADKTMIDMAVLVLDCKIEQFTFDENPARISFVFTVYNGSVYPILFNTVEGHILYGKSRLERDPFISFTTYISTNIPHTYTGKVEIVQTLTKEEVEAIQHDRNEQNPKNRRGSQFSFKPLRVIISGGADSERIAPKPLRFQRVTGVTLERRG